MNKLASQPPKQGWKQNPAAVKSDILAVATKEIAELGLSGARINVIAEKSMTSKRMIYYYFKDKKGLYRAVLESTYREIRSGEKGLNLDHLAPIEALEALVDFTFQHHKNHPESIRLIMIENIHHGEFLHHSDIIKDLNAPAIQRITGIYQRGVETGFFRTGIDPLELHWFISAFSFFNVSNKTSFGLLFGDDIYSDKGQNRLASHAKEMLLRFVLNPEHAFKYIGDTANSK